MSQDIVKVKELPTDEKANAIEMDKKLTETSASSNPTFCLNLVQEVDEGVNLATNEPRLGDESRATDGSVACPSTVLSHASRQSEFQNLVISPLANVGLGPFTRTLRPASL